MYPGEGAYPGGERYPGGGLDPGEQTTGTRDEQYNLVSVLYHSLQGAETIEAYILDAEAAGDERLAAFFREAQASYRQLAERAKERLGVLEVPPEPEVAPDAPPEGGLSPGAMAGGIPPRSGDVEPGGMGPPFDTAAPGDVPPRSADIQREPGVRADEVGVSSEGIPPTTDVPRTPPGVGLPPDEDVVAEPRGMPPGDVPQRGTSPEVPPREAPPEGAVTEGVLPGRAPEAPPPPGATPGEPGRATPGHRAAIQPEGEQEEEKDLIDKAKDKLREVKDKLTGEDRPPER